MGITMRAAKNGPEGRNLTDSKGRAPHEMA
jgi:hypothetical protein